jgi:outer membrane immunogenic protein
MKTKLFLAATAIVLSAFGSSAMAANYDGSEDGPNATYNWGGFYAGVNGGYGWNDRSIGAPTSGSQNADGALAGGTFGFNVDSGDWIFGVEGDYAWADLRGGGICTPGVACGSELNSFGTVRGRAGYDFGRDLGTNPLLVYATAGLAFGNSTVDVGASSDKKTVTGGVYGGGVEYVLGDNWSVKGEYLRAEFGHDSYDVAGVPTSGHIGSIDIARAGINYKF